MSLGIDIGIKIGGTGSGVNYWDSVNNNILKSDGTNYIETALSWTSDTVIEIKGKFTDDDGLRKLFGGTSGGRKWIGVNSARTDFYVGLGGGNSPNLLSFDEDVHVFKYDLVAMEVSIDATTAAIISYEASADTINILSSDDTSYPCRFETFYCKIWQGGSLVFDITGIENDGDIVYNRVDGSEFSVVGTLTGIWGENINQNQELLISGFDIWQNNSSDEFLYVPFDTSGSSIKTSGDIITGYTWIRKV